MTFGQFVKAIASFIAPYIAMWGATAAIPSFGLDWKILFPIFMIIAVLTILMLSVTPVKEEEITGKASTFTQCFSLLGTPVILFSFLGIMCHVGIDVGTNTTAPKLLMERFGWTLTEAGFATSLYFIFRTAGCFIGSIALAHMSHRKFYVFSIVLMALSMAGMLSGTSTAFSDGMSKAILYTSIAMVGFGNSNVFSLVFAQALQALPDKKNEVSGLMIMGLFGGTIFPLAMGFCSDLVGGQSGAIACMAVGVLYLFFYISQIKK